MKTTDLAIFDLLTQPEPELTDGERAIVRASAKTLLEHLHEKLVQDWRRKIDVLSDVNSTIRSGLDQRLPVEPYSLEVFQNKVQLVYDHVLTAYGDNGESAYDRRNVKTSHASEFNDLGSIDVGTIADDVVARIYSDPAFAARVAKQIGARDEGNVST